VVLRRVSGRRAAGDSVLTFSIILPMPDAVMPRPPNICVASSAVSRVERVMNLAPKVSIRRPTETEIHSLLEQGNRPGELVRLLGVRHLQPRDQEGIPI
jgi:hypothetical protein